ncbi:hypothetical protein EVAR_76273_1 [Eumeta japonica]|uniref:Uncharacterized protein n=1 Tax=Eumeta variegata TaxID=151549 RepID=A0A4C1UP04_EUMVA|nr:hypothetical protein EVAR_76273_1 [Eumeta japonica]
MRWSQVYLKNLTVVQSSRVARLIPRGFHARREKGEMSRGLGRYEEAYRERISNGCRLPATVLRRAGGLRNPPFLVERREVTKPCARLEAFSPQNACKLSSKSDVSLGDRSAGRSDADGNVRGL